MIVDFNRGSTDPASPLHSDTNPAVEATALLAAARDAHCPVAFTIEYDESSRRMAKAFVDKVMSLLALAPRTLGPGSTSGSRRSLASRFCGSCSPRLVGARLVPMRTAVHCDTVVVTRASTSGCVRATAAVDAFQYRYRVMVPPEAVAGRAAGPHEASLFEIDAKNGDVLSTDETVETWPGAGCS